MEENVLIIKKKRLPNGGEFVAYDESRKIAGDRWNVKIKCCVFFPWLPWMNDELKKSDLPVGSVSNHSEALVFEVVKERSFVDHQEKKETVQSMYQKLCENMESYISGEQFALKLFKQKLNELKIQLSHGTAIEADKHEIERDEPLDFSHCFK